MALMREFKGWQIALESCHTEVKKTARLRLWSRWPEISIFWIGLNDRRLEAGSDPDGPWAWSSGEPVTLRTWVSNEPDCGGVLNPREAFDDRADEDGVVCIGNLESKQLGKWRDHPTGTFYPKNIRASHVLDWNINAQNSSRAPGAWPNQNRSVGCN